MSKSWIVRVNDEAYYTGIRAENEEEAKYIAWNWFIEREPEFEVKEVDPAFSDDTDDLLKD